MKTPTFKQVLIEVRERIASHRNSRVCYAIDDVMRRYWFDASAKRSWKLRRLTIKYKARVMRRLGFAASYQQWVCIHHPDDYRRMTTDDFRAGRLQWIDYMISKEKK